jgi:hypothetical protein
LFLGLRGERLYQIVIVFQQLGCALLLIELELIERLDRLVLTTTGQDLPVQIAIASGFDQCRTLRLLIINTLSRRL